MALGRWLVGGRNGGDVRWQSMFPRQKHDIRPQMIQGIGNYSAVGWGGNYSQTLNTLQSIATNVASAGSSASTSGSTSFTCPTGYRKHPFAPNTCVDSTGLQVSDKDAWAKYNAALKPKCPTGWTPDAGDTSLTPPCTTVREGKTIRLSNQQAWKNDALYKAGQLTAQAKADKARREAEAAAKQAHLDAEKARIAAEKKAEADRLAAIANQKKPDGPPVPADDAFPENNQIEEPFDPTGRLSVLSVAAGACVILVLLLKRRRA